MKIIMNKIYNNNYKFKLSFRKNKDYDINNKIFYKI